MRLEFAFEMRLSLGKRTHIRLADGITRGAVLVEGGTFAGPGISGTIVPGSGGDFPHVWADGGGRFESQYLLETDDGAAILKRSTGVRWAMPCRRWAAAATSSYVGGVKLGGVMAGVLHAG